MRTIAMMILLPSIAYSLIPIAFNLASDEEAMYLNGDGVFLLLWLVMLIICFAGIMYARFHCTGMSIVSYVGAFACLILTFAVLGDRELIYLAAPCDIVPFLFFLLFGGAVIVGAVIGALLQRKQCAEKDSAS